MSSLRVDSIKVAPTKALAVKDAKEQEKYIQELCAKLGRTPPEYQFLELTGKGSFGKVYKG